ncbi:MAG: M24 family metallopeptidase [Mesorhizobium sp.]|nr:MAG: M24 family metallopeptidase [Mesorhizobium sp.]
MGKPSDSVRRAADTSKAALDAAIAAMRPDVTSGEVDAACRGTVARAGLAMPSSIEPATPWALASARAGVKDGSWT